MKLRDYPLRKKLLLSNILMIVIPALLVLFIVSATVIGLMAVTGSGSRAVLLVGASDTVSNYQLQLVFDSICEKLAGKEDTEEAKELQKLYGALEHRGAQVWVRDGERSHYLSAGADTERMEAQTHERTSKSSGESLFYRGVDGLVYQMPIQTEDGRKIQLLIVSEQLVLQSGSQPVWGIWDTVKSYLKWGGAAVGSAAIIVIVLTGVLLSVKLSKSIAAPLGQLRRAANEIQNGNLNCSVDVVSQDELGQACHDFDQMRLRLKESVVLQQKYETGRRELLAGISHDLATPLTSIKGYVSGLIDGIADTPEKRERYLHTIYTTACNMDRLVDSLFLFSKLDMDQVPFEMEHVYLNDYLEDFCSEAKQQLAEKQMDLFFACPVSKPIRVSIDRVQFGRVLSNLMENSAKYKKDGQGAIWLTLEYGDENRVQVRFVDDGCGVGNGEVSLIFDHFYRTDPARSNTVKGNGIGLAIARQIIEHMGGTIRAEGHLGEGLTIILTLPTVGEERVD